MDKITIRCVHQRYVSSIFKEYDDDTNQTIALLNVTPAYERI